MKTTRPKIMLVEDDFVSQEMVQGFLKSRYDILVAESVIASRLILKQNRIDLIILDLSLKGDEDGLDLVRELKAEPKTAKIPIVVTTAHAYDRDRERCLEAGCDVYLSKPFMGKQLVAEVGKFIS